MSYQPSIDFNFPPAVYQVPAADAVDFVLDNEGPAINYQIPPAVVMRVGGRWDTSRSKTNITSVAVNEAKAIQRYKPFASNSASVLLQGESNLGWNAFRKLENRRAESWGKASKADAGKTSGFATLFPRDLHQQIQWDHSSQPEDKHIGAEYRYAEFKDNTKVDQWRMTSLYAPPVKPEDLLPEVYLLSDFVQFNFGQPYWPPAALVDFLFQPGERLDTITQPKNSTHISVYGRSLQLDQDRHFPWGRGQYYRKHREWGVDYPTYNGPIGKQEPDQPEIKLSYIIMNTVSVVKLPEETPLDVRDISIDLDIDSWAWTMTGTVRGNASLNQIKPTVAGLTDIRVTINGHAWVFMIERYTGDRTVGNDIYRIQGVSRTQYLAVPYAPKRSYINGSSINAKQAMEDELNGTGFTLEWLTVGDEETPNWNIPTGALAYTGKTPLEVIKWIADAAGAIVYPAPDADTLTIRPRYPTPPWQIDTATMDRVITASMVRSISEEWIPAALYNAAYVSGISVGRGTMVTRTGTAGDQPAPDTFSELQVAVECNQTRGEAIIAASGNRSMYRMDLHIPESVTAPGLVIPGYEVEFQGEDTWRGYVVATSISASGPGAAPVWQQITIERPLEHLL